MDVTSNVKTLDKADFEDVYSVAFQAGMLAADDCTPTPMHVVERENPLDDSSAIKHAYAPVMSGVCGFAWVNVKPGTSAFARWLKKEGHGRTDSYYGGVTVWIGEHGQSYERKQAHASEMAQVLRTHGVNAQSMSRLD
jgi:hypothetical protein